MRKKSLVFFYLALGCVALVVPLASSFYLAWYDGRAGAQHYLEQLSADVLRRSQETRKQVDMAISAIQAAPQQAPCSPEQLLRMRAVAAGAGYLKGLGYVRNGTLVCVSFSHIESPLQLGAPSRITPSGVTSWSSVTLPNVPGVLFNINSRDNFAAIIPQALVLDTLPDDSISLTHVSDHGVIVRSRGVFLREWLEGYEGKPLTFSDADYFVTIRPADNAETSVVAAMTAEQVQAKIVTAMWHMVPIGLLISCSLATLVYVLARYRLSLKAQLQRALSRREFYLLYQPVVDLRSGCCVGAEALLRWQRPANDAISPSVFIPAAEKHGLIVQITGQVMEMVAKDTVQLLRDHPDTHIAINFSAADLHSAETETRLQALITNAGGSSRNILIEATERGFMSPEKAKGLLVSVRSKGFKVAIDDFGTGNSSLSYLATYDLDYLKIDKMFVDALGSDTPSSRVAFHIIAMAKTLNLQMIAEGVETEQQRDILRDAGVQFGQGWVFGKPMSMDALAAFIRAHHDGAGTPSGAPTPVGVHLPPQDQ